MERPARTGRDLAGKMATAFRVTAPSPARCTSTAIGGRRIVGSRARTAIVGAAALPIGAAANRPLTTDPGTSTLMAAGKSECSVTPSDIEALIAQCGLRDRAAFSRLYDATSAKLFGVALRVLDNRPEAEDVLQESFLKIWHSADRYAANGLSPMTWLITIVRNTAIDRLRTRNTRREDNDVSLAAMPARGPTPEQAAIAAGEAARILRCMDQLPDDHRAAVRGAYLRGYSYADLARAADVPLNTMRTWLRRSLISLRACLER